MCAGSMLTPGHIDKGDADVWKVPGNNLIISNAGKTDKGNPRFPIHVLHLAMSVRRPAQFLIQVCPLDVNR